MRKYLYLFILIITLVLIFGAYKIERMPKLNNQSFSQEAADASLSSFSEIVKAKVTKVLSDDEEQNKHFSQITQALEVNILNGQEKGQQAQASYQDQLSQPNLQRIKVGDVLVLGKIQDPSGNSWVVVDRYRLNPLLWMFGIFLALAVIFGRRRGLTSLAGLAAGIAILIYFVTPNLLDGKNPTMVTIVGAGLIAIISMFFAHGFKSRTAIAIISTLITLGLAEGAATIFVGAAKLLGTGTQEALYLQQGFLGNLNLQGLLLGGVLIATLGILNDITTAQAAAVEEIYDADKTLSFKKLYTKAASVGREHIASLINTLVLVYAGASLPLFLLLTVTNQQLWVTLNSATLAEEIVRTLIGSMALILAVPITTALTAYFIHFQAAKSSSMVD